jgi:hypothetical protein
MGSKSLVESTEGHNWILDQAPPIFGVYKGVLELTLNYGAISTLATTVCCFRVNFLLKEYFSLL